jgi:hypothetical protein
MPAAWGQAPLTTAPLTVLDPAPHSGFNGGDTTGARLGVNDPRKTLLLQMAALRRAIDPAVLRRVEQVAQGQEPYDKAAAQAVVRSFLAAKTKADGGAFQRRLLAALKTEALAGTPAPAPAKPPPAPNKPWVGPSDPRTQTVAPKRPPKRP